MSEGVHLEAIFKGRLRRIRLALVVKEASKDQPVDLAGRFGNEVAIGVSGCLMTRAENQIFTAFAFVWARAAHVDHKAEEGVIDRAGTRARWNFDHHWAITEV